MSANSQLWAIVGRGLVPTPTSSVSGTPVLQAGGKHQHCSSNQSASTPEGPRQDGEEAANDEDAPEECPHRRSKEGKALKEPRKGAFSEESNIIKVPRQVYQKTHQANFEQEGSYNLGGPKGPQGC